MGYAALGGTMVFVSNAFAGPYFRIIEYWKQFAGCRAIWPLGILVPSAYLASVYM